MAVWDNIIPQSDLKMFDKGGMGQLMGAGKKPAVIVVDMSYAFVDERYPLGSPTGPKAATAIKHLLDVARPKKTPIIYSTGCEKHLPVDYGRWKSQHTLSPSMAAQANKIWPEIAPGPEDVVIVKTKPSVFFGTDLVSRLTFFNVDTLIITGMVTSGCVRATVVDAFSYNYYIVIPEECVADRGDISHRVSLFDMHMKYGDVVPLAQVEDYLKKL